MKRGIDKTKRINFLNSIIGKNLQVTDIIDMRKINVTRIEYNLSIINSKGVQVQDRYSWYTYDWKSKTLNMVR